MKTAIMQPYFFPYIGYFHLINSVDKFVIYDDIEYTKKGWINRNRILVNKTDKLITVPIKNDSDYLNINQRFIAETFQSESKKLLALVSNSYRKAPFFNEVFPLFEKCILQKEKNLFFYLQETIRLVMEFLELKAELIVSSSIGYNSELKSTQKVISICKSLGTTIYINPIGGLTLYKKGDFEAQNIQLVFNEPQLKPYPQFDHDFIPSLSIIDVLMFNGKEGTQKMLTDYKLIA